jgi:hypothetical protein
MGSTSDQSNNRNDRNSRKLINTASNLTCVGNMAERVLTKLQEPFTLQAPSRRCCQAVRQRHA